jgi:hypothetical protein
LRAWINLATFEFGPTSWPHDRKKPLTSAFFDPPPTTKATNGRENNCGDTALAFASNLSMRFLKEIISPAICLVSFLGLRFEGGYPLLKFLHLDGLALRLNDAGDSTCLLRREFAIGH